MHDAEFLFHFHLQGKDVTVTIDRVTAGELTGEKGRKSRKPILHLRGKKLPLALCKTNCKTIAAMYGNAVEGWIGKAVTLYATTTEFGGRTVECIRIRPAIPKQSAAEQPAPEGANDHAAE